MAAAPPPDALRCQRNGGRGWRCRDVKRDDHPYCERHYQAKRQRSSTELGYGCGDASTGNHRRSRKFRSLSDWSDDVETHWSDDVETQEDIAMNIFEIRAKRLSKTHKCASSAVQLGEENERLKAVVEGLKNQCADLRTKTESDASEVQQLKAQLNAQRARRLHDLLNSKGLEKENELLKSEMEGLKRQCFELKSRTESDASEILRLEYQLISERVKVLREFGVTRTGTSPVAAISDPPAEKDESYDLFERSRNDTETGSSTIREMQSFIEMLEGKLASSMEREATLRVSIMLSGRSADAEVKQARQAGYNEGLSEGRRSSCHSQTTSNPGVVL